MLLAQMVCVSQFYNKPMRYRAWCMHSSNGWCLNTSSKKQINDVWYILMPCHLCQRNVKQMNSWHGIFQTQIYHGPIIMTANWIVKACQDLIMTRNTKGNKHIQRTKTPDWSTLRHTTHSLKPLHTLTEHSTYDFQNAHLVHDFPKQTFHPFCQLFSWAVPFM